MTRKKAAIRVGITILLILVMVAAARAIAGFDLQQVLTAIHGASWTCLSLAFLVALVQVLFQYIRYDALFSPQGRPPRSQLTNAIFIGQFLNSFTPMRAGDAYKLTMTTKGRSGTSVSRAGALVLAERISDNIGLIILAICGDYGFLLRTLENLWGGASHQTALMVGVVTLFVLTVGGFLLGRSPRVKTAVLAFWKDLRTTMVSGRFLASTAWSTAGWFVEAACLWITCYAFGLNLPFSHIAAAIMMLQLGVAVPVTVANAGVFEAALAFGLSRFGVDPPTALAVGTVHHLALLSALLFWAAAQLGWEALGRGRRRAALGS
jgi:uncharacterized membrane protein YbhN (UPF0104 family)